MNDPSLSKRHHPNKENLQDTVLQIFLQSELLSNQLRACEFELLQAKSHVCRLESESSGLCSKLDLSAKKKNRRTSREIEKSHECPYEKCHKKYGSEVSLNLHIKIKHNGGNKTERERLAREILISRVTGSEQPPINLNLPPGLLDRIQTL